MKKKNKLFKKKNTNEVSFACRRLKLACRAVLSSLCTFRQCPVLLQAVKLRGLKIHKLAPIYPESTDYYLAIDRQVPGFTGHSITMGQISTEADLGFFFSSFITEGHIKRFHWIGPEAYSVYYPQCPSVCLYVCLRHRKSPDLEKTIFLWTLKFWERVNYDKFEIATKQCKSNG